MNKTCIIIVGATASGKTNIAIDIATHFHTEIISADSRQCFKELNIGVAKPTQAQLSSIPHHFINSHSIHENVTAADFEKYALVKTEKIFEQNNTVVMCGGTGLYIKAFTEGLDEIPQTDPTIKNEVAENYQLHGIDWLQQQIKVLDPLFWQQGEIQNPHRLMRALEVIMNTGKSILAQQKKTKKQRPFNIIKIGLDVPRDILYERINNRVDVMRDNGLEAEVRSLIPFKKMNALQTVSYRELFDYFEEKTSLEKTFELIKQNTRHYAKRQMTWFKKEQEIQWLKPEDIMACIEKINIEH